MRDDARRDDPALHARPGRGRGARRPGRHPRPRRAALRSSRPTSSSAATAPTRSRRRSSPRPAARSRTRPTRTTTSERRCSHESRSPARCAHELIGARRRRRAQRLPDASATSGGTSRSSSGRSRTRSRSSSSPRASRRPAAQIDVNRATTTLLIGAVVWAYLGIIFEFLTETVAWERWEGTIEYTFMAPLSRAMHLGGQGVFAVLYGLVAGGPAVRRRRVLLRPRDAGRELRRGARRARRRVGLVHRDRDDDRGAAADLAGEGHAARLRRAGHAARRLGRLLPGRGAADVDGVDLDDLAGDVRAATASARRSSRAPGSSMWRRRSGRCS